MSSSPPRDGDDVGEIFGFELFVFFAVLPLPTVTDVVRFGLGLPDFPFPLTVLFAATAAVAFFGVGPSGAVVVDVGVVLLRLFGTTITTSASSPSSSELSLSKAKSNSSSLPWPLSSTLAPRRGALLAGDDAAADFDPPGDGYERACPTRGGKGGEELPLPVLRFGLGDCVVCHQGHERRYDDEEQREKVKHADMRSD